MSSYYSIIQYVPDAFRDERINVGVVAFDDQVVRCYVVKNKARLKDFGGANAAKFLDLMWYRFEKRMTPEAVREAAVKWQNAFRLTDPSGSVLSVDSLLADMATRVLIDPPPAQTDHLRKTDVVEKTKNYIGFKLQAKFNSQPAKLLLRSDFVLDGIKAPHTFDVGIVNGAPQWVGQCLSFQIRNRRTVESQTSSSSWMFTDIRNRSDAANVKLTAVVAKPTFAGEIGEIYDRFVRLMDEYNVQVGDTNDFSWADNLVDSIDSHE